MEKCKHSNACRIEASREFFGNSECPGTDDAEMTLLMVYSCDGGTDKSSSYKPNCKPEPEPEIGGNAGITDNGACTGVDVKQGEMKQVDIPGCGGWVNLDCTGGCINIVKVLKA